MKRILHPTTLYLVARNTLVLLFCWGLAEGLLVAQEAEEGLDERVLEGDQEEYIDFTEGVVDDPGARMETREVNGREEITVSLDNVSLEDTVRLFAQTTGANIVSSGTLMTGQRVTVNLTDVHWRPALRSILELHNLDLVERPDTAIYSVRERAPDALEPTEVRTFFLDYTTVGEVQASIQSMLGPSAIITPYASRNAIVIRSTEGNLSEIEKLIRELDFPSRQVLIEAKIIELNDEARKAVGIDWSMLQGYRIGAEEMEWSVFDARESERIRRDRQLDYFHDGRQSGSLDFRDPSGAVVEEQWFSSWRSQPLFPDLLDGSDRPRFPDPSTLSSEDQGTVWGSSGRYRMDERARGRTDESLFQHTTDKVASEVKSAVLSPADFSIMLSALERLDGVSMVSNPKIIVTSGSTNAFFSIGDRDPIIETEVIRGTQDSPGDTLIAKLATGINTDFIRQGYLETGIDLGVIATVKTDDFIEAEIRPSLRRLIDFKQVGDNSWPIISVKEIGTSFTLRSGQTVAIGGLTGSEEGKITKRVPILGSIPLLGRLFRHEETVQLQNETIIFVTLSVADPDGLKETAGVPENARLVHTHRIRERARREEFHRELREMEEAEALSVEMELKPDVPVQDQEEADVEWIPDRRQPDNDPAVPR